MRAMVEGLRELLPAGSTFTRPQGGVFVWVELAPGWSAPALLERAVEHGIFFMPGSVFFADVDSHATLRLSISNHTPDSVAEGLNRLAATFASTRAPAGAGARRR
jgi:DNA-binding transcriptional MocR family regulator